MLYNSNGWTDFGDLNYYIKLLWWENILEHYNIGFELIFRSRKPPIRSPKKGNWNLYSGNTDALAVFVVTPTYAAFNEKQYGAIITWSLFVSRSYSNSVQDTFHFCLWNNLFLFSALPSQNILSFDTSKKLTIRGIYKIKFI